MDCDLNVTAVRPAGDDAAMVRLDFDDIEMARRCKQEGE